MHRVWPLFYTSLNASFADLLLFSWISTTHISPLNVNDFSYSSGTQSAQSVSAHLLTCFSFMISLWLFNVSFFLFFIMLAGFFITVAFLSSLRVGHCSPRSDPYSTPFWLLNVHRLSWDWFYTILHATCLLTFSLDQLLHLDKMWQPYVVQLVSHHSTRAIR